MNIIPFKWRLIRYTADPSFRYVDAVSRSGRVHKIGHDTASGSQGSFADPEQSDITDSMLERYRDEAEQLQDLTMNDAYEQQRHHWNPYYYEQRVHPTPLRMLLIIDGSAGEWACLQMARWLAEHYHAALHLAVRGTSVPQVAELRARLEQQLGSVKPPFTSKPPIETYVTDDTWAEATLAIAQREVSSLLIMPKPTNAEVDPNVKQLLMNSQCPILLVDSQQVALPIAKILIPLDGSDFSYPAISQGIILSQDLGAELSLLHADTSQPEEVSSQRQDLKGVMNRIIWQDVKHEFLLDQGSPVSTILHHAAEDAIDLVIMTMHRVSAQDQQSIPSVTLEVLSQLSCSLLVLHA